MGLSPISQVVYGLKISKKTTKAFLKWKKENNNLSDDAILMMIIEEMIKFWWKNKSCRFFWMLAKYLKVNRRKKMKRCYEPYIPFWSGYKKSDLKKMKEEEKFDKYFVEYIQSVLTKKEEIFGIHNNIILPIFDVDEGIENFIGIEYGDENYGRDVDWSLMSVLNLPPEGGLVKVPGMRPWETGTKKIKDKWFTFNGENMFSLPHKEIPEKDRRLLYSFSGTRKQYIVAKKEAYYRLCPNEKAYYNHENEMWGWSAMTYAVVDFIYEFICKHVPEIKYNYMKLEKYISFSWR